MTLLASEEEKNGLDQWEFILEDKNLEPTMAYV